MLAAGDGQDYFGTGFVGFDPFHQAAADKLGRLSTLDSILNRPPDLQQQGTPGQMQAGSSGGGTDPYYSQFMPQGSGAPGSFGTSGLGQDFFLNSMPPSGFNQQAWNSVLGPQAIAAPRQPTPSAPPNLHPNPNPGGIPDPATPRNCPAGYVLSPSTARCVPVAKDTDPKPATPPDGGPAYCPPGYDYIDGRCIDNGQGPNPTGPSNGPPPPPTAPPPTAPPQQGTPRTSPPSTASGATPDQQRLYGNYGAGGQGLLPPDLAILRGQLSQLLGGNLGGPEAYRGPLTTQMPGYLDQVLRSMQGQPGFAQQNLGPGYSALDELQPAQRALMGGFGTAQQLSGTQGPVLGANILAANQRLLDPMQNSGFMQQLAMQGPEALQRMLAPGMASATNMAMTGGTPDISGALNDIQSRSKLQLEDTLAGIREQYGKMGLAAGSDVSGALGRGAASGIADMNAQMSQLQAQVGLAGAQNRLGGISALGQLGGLQNQAGGSAISQLLGMAGQSANQNQMAVGNLQSLSALDAQTRLGGLGALGNLSGQYNQAQLGAAGQYGQFADLLNQALGQSNQGQMGIGAMQMGNQTQNNQNLLNEFLRMQSPSPWQNSAMSYATSYPPVQQQIGPSTGASLGAAGISAGGSILSAILPYMMLMSSSQAKRGIQAVTGILPALRQLGIYRWQYKDGGPQHLGPMAEDFRLLFGVGDGVTLNIVDVLGVLLGAVKELSLEVQHG